MCNFDNHNHKNKIKIIFVLFCKIYFRLSFGLANTINTYLRLKVRAGREGDIFSYTKYESDLFLNIRNLSN